MELAKMEKAVEKIRADLLKIGEMRPGSLNKQYTVCGRSGCRCQDPQHPKRHGPYFQLSYVHNGKSTTQFVQKDLVPMVRCQLQSYKKFKALISRWVELALAIAREKLALERERLKTDGPSGRE